MITQTNELSQHALIVDRITRSLERKLESSKPRLDKLVGVKRQRSTSFQNLHSTPDLRQILKLVETECFGENRNSAELPPLSVRRKAQVRLPTNEAAAREEEDTPRPKRNRSADKVMQDLAARIKDVKTLENLIKHKRAESELSAKKTNLLSGELSKLGKIASNFAVEAKGPQREIFKLIAKHIKFANKIQKETNNQTASDQTVFNKRDKTGQDGGLVGTPDLSHSFYSRSEYAQDDQVLLELYKKSAEMLKVGKGAEDHTKKKPQTPKAPVPPVAGKAESKKDSDSLDMDQMIEFKPTSQKDDGSDKLSNLNDDEMSQSFQPPQFRSQLPGGVFNRVHEALLSPPPQKKKGFGGFFTSTKHLPNPSANKPRSPLLVLSGTVLKNSNFTDGNMQQPKLQHAASLGDSLNSLQRIKRQSSNPVPAIEPIKLPLQKRTTDHGIRTGANLWSGSGTKEQDDLNSVGESDKNFRKTNGSQVMIKITPPSSHEGIYQPRKANSTGEVIEHTASTNLIPKSRSPKRWQLDLVVPHDVIRETEEEDNRTATYISAKGSRSQDPIRQESYDFGEPSVAAPQIQLFKNDTTEQVRAKDKLMTAPEPTPSEQRDGAVKERPRSRGQSVPTIVVNYVAANVSSEIPSLEELKNMKAKVEATEQVVRNDLANNADEPVPQTANYNVEPNRSISLASGSDGNGPMRKASLNVPDMMDTPDNLFMSQQEKEGVPVSSQNTASFGKWETQGGEGNPLKLHTAETFNPMFGQGLNTPRMSERKIIKKVAEFPKDDKPPVEDNKIAPFVLAKAVPADQNSYGCISSRNRKQQLAVSLRLIPGKTIIQQFSSQLRPHLGVP